MLSKYPSTTSVDVLVRRLWSAPGKDGDMGEVATDKCADLRDGEEEGE